MSLEVLTQGGGAGGASASIFVTGLSEADAVTASNGSKTVNGKWVTKHNLVPVEIPVMTSNTEPSGSCYAIHNGSLINEVYAAFDGQTHTAVGIGNIASYPVYFVYDFGNKSVNPKSFYGYAEHAWDRVGQGTGSWTVQLQGSNDGQVWENISDEVYWEDKGLAWQTSSSTESVNIVTEIDTDKFYTKFRLAVLDSYATNSSFIPWCTLFTFQVTGVTKDVVSGHEIPKIDAYGMWTVTATNGEETVTQDVLVDAAVEHEIEMAYFFEYTEFDEKGQSWVEEGGTFNYGDGLYQESGSAKGSVVFGNDRHKYLTIPVETSTAFELEASGIVTTTSNSEMGGFGISALDENGTEVAKLIRLDAWGASSNQLYICSLNESNIYETSGLSGYNGVTVALKIQYDGTTLKFYRDSALLHSVATVLNPIGKIRVTFSSYYLDSNPTPYVKVNYLKFTNQEVSQ